MAVPCRNHGSERALEGMASRNLMDISGVAERLGVSQRHIRRLVFERRIPFIKWGHLLRFDPDEIDSWLDDARQPPIPA